MHNPFSLKALAANCIIRNDLPVDNVPAEVNVFIAERTRKICQHNLWLVARETAFNQFNCCARWDDIYSRDTATWTQRLHCGINIMGQKVCYVRRYEECNNSLYTSSTFTTKRLYCSKECVKKGSVDLLRICKSSPMWEIDLLHYTSTPI